MQKNLKGFLVPVAAASAALTAGSAQANVAAVATAALQENKQQPNNFATQAAGEVVTITLGDELHSLTLAPTQRGIKLAAHGSHVSHGSHGSHRSHVSSS